MRRSVPTNEDKIKVSGLPPFAYPILWHVEGSKSLLRKPVSLSKGSDVLQTAVGVVLAPTRFSLVRISMRDLVPDRNPYKGTLGLAVEGNI